MLATVDVLSRVLGITRREVIAEAVLFYQDLQSHHEEVIADMERLKIKKRLRHVEHGIVRYEAEREELLKRQDEFLKRRKAMYKTIKLVTQPSADQTGMRQKKPKVCGRKEV